MLLVVLSSAACGGNAPTTASTADVATAKATKKAGEKAAAPKETPSGDFQLPGYVGTFKNNPRLTPERVAAWTPKELRIKRNELYARYGRAFQSKDLQTHFGRQSWYQERKVYSDAMLTDNDHANVALIQAFEAEPATWEGQVDELMFMDEHTLVISDGNSIYAHIGEERRYAARGQQYLITWRGTERFAPHNPSMVDVELWTRLDRGWTRTPVKLARG